MSSKNWIDRFKEEGSNVIKILDTLLGETKGGIALIDLSMRAAKLAKFSRPGTFNQNRFVAEELCKLIGLKYAPEPRMDSIVQTGLTEQALKDFKERLDYHVRAVDSASKATQHMPDSQLKRAKKVQNAFLAFEAELKEYMYIKEFYNTALEVSHEPDFVITEADAEAMKNAMPMSAAVAEMIKNHGITEA